MGDGHGIPGRARLAHGPYPPDGSLMLHRQGLVSAPPELIATAHRGIQHIPVQAPGTRPLGRKDNIHDNIPCSPKGISRGKRGKGEKGEKQWAVGQERCTR
ncbi:hypothetical protein L202_01506 [Cryptococcus amylolentus CBS 6039]|uniref:Uncharacterized protein n=1 Tax=Cryptococcus amylolentus CBS 6039 TaxID=1295533 RepID=A0A1E3I4A8_9TREE|nr:hypothetical protein L202_01506 [Cryptococcus amylolentus CBS 6039]ODN83347.1 hypothetical protein L202_01506 [Cryptococcus amylolentus CBS 6039]